MTKKSKSVPLVWDESQVIEDHAKYLLEEGEAADEKQAFDMACCDADHIGFEYEDFITDFSAILKRISKKGRFHIEGKNMGWRHLSGELDLDADNARDFITRTFPRTSEWKLQGEFDPCLKTLSYKLFHHDAPTGEEYRIEKRL